MHPLFIHPAWGSSGPGASAAAVVPQPARGVPNSLRGCQTLGDFEGVHTHVLRSHRSYKPSETAVPTALLTTYRSRFEFIRPPLGKGLVSSKERGQILPQTVKSGHERQNALVHFRHVLLASLHEMTGLDRNLLRIEMVVRAFAAEVRILLQHL